MSEFVYTVERIRMQEKKILEIYRSQIESIAFGLGTNYNHYQFKFRSNKM